MAFLLTLSSALGVHLPRYNPGNDSVKVLRFHNFNLEDSLRSENERQVFLQDQGVFSDEILELEYETIDASSVPHVHDFLKSRGSSSSSPTCPDCSPSKMKNTFHAAAYPVFTTSSQLPISSFEAMSKPSKKRPASRPQSPSQRLKFQRSKSPSFVKAPTARQLRAKRKTELARARRRGAAQRRDGGNEVSQRVLETAQSAIPMHVDGFNALSMLASDPGWIGTKELPQAKLPPASKLKDFNWDGKVTVVFLDRLDRIWSVLGAPPPKAKDWKEVNCGLMQALEEYDRNSTFSSKDMSNRRAGDLGTNSYAIRNTGVSHGGGQREPGNVAVCGLRNKAAVAALSKNQYMGRLVGHTGRLYTTFANRLASESRRVCQELHKKNPELIFPSHPSPNGGYWAARSYNTAGWNESGAAVTVRHTDFGNWAPGWCCVTAIGSFDPDKGGHLILWNVGLRIRFPPGCSILFPSAVITHSNERIQPEEKRYSVVQYSAGGLFRWVYNGFQTDESVLDGLKEKELKRWQEDRRCRWKEGVRLYTKWYELVKGDYKGKELEEESDLTDYEYESESDLTQYEYSTDEEVV
ncbi:hypothetical protein VNI00_011198 [Paramarasmius palmivorus]|uniref:Uncharacterized protein n=1 Tax=Paramarasmius palmivorus TaxID=297713 RepID=A0AAW0CGY1_9AGAR